MAELISSLIGGGSTYLIGAGAVILAFAATYVRGRLSGAKLERIKQKAKETDAYEKHLQDIADAGNARPTGSVSDDPYNRDR